MYHLQTLRKYFFSIFLAQCKRWNVSLWTVGQGDPPTSQNLQVTTTVSGCLPEVDKQSLLLKTQHALVAGHGVIKLELTYLLGFLAPKSAMQTTNRRRLSVVLPS